MSSIPPDNSSLWMQPQSIYERFQPHHLWLADQFANSSNQRMDLDGVMNNSMQGMSIDQQDQMDREQKAAGEQQMQEARLQQLSGQLAQSMQHLDDSQFKQALETLKQQVNSPHAQLQQAPLENPNALQSGFALLGAALFPKQAGDIGASPFQAQLKSQQDQQALNNQNYAIQEKNRSEGISNAQDIASLEGQQYRNQLDNQTRTQNNIQTQMTQVQNQLARLDQQHQQAIEKAYTEFDRANTYQEKLISGKRLQFILKGTGLEPSDQEIDQAAQTEKLKSMDRARLDADSFIKRFSQDGVVDDADAAQINEHYRQTEKLYGLPDGYLGKAPTYETVRAQSLKLAQDRFQFVKGATRQRLEMAWANLHVAEQRQQTYATSVANQAALGQGNLDQRAYSNQLDLYKIQTGQAFKDYAKESLPAIKQLKDDVDVATKVAQSNPSQANNDAVVKAQAKLDNVLRDISERAGISTFDILKDPEGTIKRITQTGSPAETPPSVPSTPQIDATGAVKPGKGSNSPPLTFDPLKGKIGPGGTKAQPKKKTGSGVDYAKQRGWKVG